MNEIEQTKDILLKHGYKYKEHIGSGSFSSVLLCESTKYKQDFAIKRAIKSKITEYEYNTLVSLEHSNIIKLYDAFDDEDVQYLVMEYCPNGTIRQKGVHHYDQFVTYAKQILEAIDYCHSRNIAHRDIKPDNIFLDYYNHIKLADFGMAKQFNENKSKDMCGSFRFFSPEMLEYQEICPFKADIWALGITFFYMATGSYPFESNSLEQMKQFIIYGEISFKYHEVDPKICFLIKKMTEKSPSLRPSADKLLRFPIFNKNVHLKKSFLFKSVPKHRNYAILQSNSMTFDMDTNNSPENKNPCLASVHSYKSDVFTTFVQRTNYRFHPTKPT